MAAQDLPQHHGDDGELAWALHRLAVASAALDSVMAQRLGMSSTDYSAMKHVMAADPPIGPVELGRLLGMTSGSATMLVDRLHRSGHLERQPHPHDRRRRALSATPHALHQILAELEPIVADLKHLDADFTPAERHVIARYLTGVADRYTSHRA